KTTFVMKASEIVPGKDESKKCLKACLWHVEGIFCLKTKPGTIAADCNRRWFWDRPLKLPNPTNRRPTLGRCSIEGVAMG
ncbi:MAG: hypothetical protein OXB88_06680, partial [Bacteriovoracales bacterium]|nr:hypothetical protein [Bacteriovoracales bacterium]